jgi:hypothetical protein
VSFDVDKILDKLERVRALALEACDIGRDALAIEGWDHDECEGWNRLAAIRAEVIRGA